MIKLLIALILSSLLIDNTSYGEKAEERMIDTYDFIQKYECPGWPRHLEAYWDHKWYSIGCGTRSHKGEKITKEQALERFYDYIDLRIDLVKKDFPNATQRQQTALVSLASNNGTCYAYHKRHGLSRAQWLECDKVRIDWKLVPFRGLTKRRIDETNLYF